MVSTIDRYVEDEKSMISCVINGREYNCFTSDTFYNDTGTSCTLGDNMDRLYDTTEIGEKVGDVTSQSVSAIWKGKKVFLVTYSDGSMVELMGVTVKVCPAASVKLFATMTEAGRRVSGVSRRKILEISSFNIQMGTLLCLIKDSLCDNTSYSSKHGGGINRNTNNLQELRSR